jgi:hypothetical protein
LLCCKVSTSNLNLRHSWLLHTGSIRNRSDQSLS